MKLKYDKGNTRVLLDLGPLYARLAAYAVEVGISLSAVIRIILNDAIIRGSITLPPLDGSSQPDQVTILSGENGEGELD